MNVFIRFNDLTADEIRLMSAVLRGRGLRQLEGEKWFAPDDPKFAWNHLWVDLLADLKAVFWISFRHVTSPGESEISFSRKPESDVFKGP